MRWLVPLLVLAATTAHGEAGVTERELMTAIAEVTDLSLSADGSRLDCLSCTPFTAVTLELRGLPSPVENPAGFARMQSSAHASACQDMPCEVTTIEVAAGLAAVRMDRTVRDRHDRTYWLYDPFSVLRIHSVGNEAPTVIRNAEAVLAALTDTLSYPALSIILPSEATE